MNRCLHNTIANRGLLTSGLRSLSSSLHNVSGRSSSSSSSQLTIHSYSEQRALLRGDAVAACGPVMQVRYNFIKDFFANFRTIVDETPEYKETFDQFRKTFLFWRKPKKPTVDTTGDGYTGPGGMPFGQEQQGQQQQGMDQTQQQQQAEGQTEEQPKEKVYASKEEELRDKYKEYYKDYEQRKAQADIMSVFMGQMTEAQTEQLNKAYQETLGVRPPYPPQTRFDYSQIGEQLRDNSFEERLELPLEYYADSIPVQFDEMLEFRIDEEDEKHLPDLIMLMKQREIELREKGLDPPPVDWDSMTSVDQFDEIPEIYKDSFEPTEEELEKIEGWKLPIPIVRDNWWKWQNARERRLDFLVKIFEYVPSLGGNYLYYYLGKLSRAFTKNKFNKLFMDHKNYIMPGFDMHKFQEVAKSHFFPEFLNLFLVGNVEELEDYCSESGLKMVKGIIEARESGHKVLDDRFISFDHFEFTGVRYSESSEDVLFIFSMVVHHSHCIRDYTYAVVQGGENDVVSTKMNIALVYDVDTCEFGYVVHRIRINPSRSIYL